MCNTWQDAEDLIETDEQFDTYDGYISVECGASLNLVWADDDYGCPGVNLTVQCPNCEVDETRIENVAEDWGSREVSCDGCGADLEVTWSDWKVAPSSPSAP